MEDIASLQSETKVFVIADPELGKEALFPAEMMGIKVDEDVITQFHEVQLPHDVMELQAAVRNLALSHSLSST